MSLESVSRFFLNLQCGYAKATPASSAPVKRTKWLGKRRFIQSLGTGSETEFWSFWLPSSKGKKGGKLNPLIYSIPIEKIMT